MTDIRTDTSQRHGRTPDSPYGTPVYNADADAIATAVHRSIHPSPETAPEHLHQLPPLDIPGFGDPLDDCGDYTIAASQFCTLCGKHHENKRNCYRYDCPQHAPYAVRRRAAGSSSNTGIVPQLDALRRYLNHHRDDNQYFHHLVISPPDDWHFESATPLERGRDVVRDIMNELGIQGTVILHPWRGENEDGHDDRGKWQERLFHRRDWTGDVRDELEFSPHFHVIGVAPHVDIGVTDAIENDTGWVIHRIANADGISIPDDDAMASAVLYALSHAGIYDPGNGDRRLAAWMKGPDVDHVDVYEENGERARAITNHAAQDTLGLAPPKRECEHDVQPAVRDNTLTIHDPDAADGSVTIDTWPWPTAPDGTSQLGREPGRTDLPRGSTTSAATGPSGLAGSGDLADDPGHPGEGVPDDDRDPEHEACGGHLRHISKAGDYLLSGDWRDTAPHADELEEVYRNYIDYMTTRGLDPIEDAIPTVPEHDVDGPPPD